MFTFICAHTIKTEDLCSCKIKQTNRMRCHPFFFFPWTYGAPPHFCFKSVILINQVRYISHIKKKKKKIKKTNCYFYFGPITFFLKHPILSQGLRTCALVRSMQKLVNDARRHRLVTSVNAPGKRIVSVTAPFNRCFESSNYLFTNYKLWLWQVWYKSFVY